MGGRIKKQPVSGKLFYLTNNYNLRTILSAGYIGDSFSFEGKYYPDLLADAPGYIPLFSNLIDPEFYKHVCAFDPDTSFPVLLEIDATSLTGMQPVSAGNDAPSLPIVFYSVPIALRSVSAIIFLSERDLREFSVRVFADLPHRKEMYKVADSPLDGASFLELYRAALSTLPPVSESSQARLKLLNRASGAVCLSIAYVSDANMKAHLKEMLTSSRLASEGSAGIPSFFRHGFLPLESESYQKLDLTDDVLFYSILKVLYQTKPDDLTDKAGLAQAVEETVLQHPFIDTEKESLRKWFRKIGAILNLDEDFTGFKDKQPYYEPLRAFLLFLLRKDYGALMVENPEEANATRDTLLTALVYAGIITGRNALDVRYRPDELNLDLADRSVASWYPAPASPTVRKPKAAKKPVSTDSAELFPVPSHTQDQPAVSMASGLEEFLTADFSDNQIRMRAIETCRELGWNDCLVNTICFSARSEFKIEGGAESVNLIVEGPVTLMADIRVDLFRANIRKLSSAQLQVADKDSLINPV